MVFALHFAVEPAEPEQTLRGKAHAYKVDFKPRTQKDLHRLSKTESTRVLDALLKLQDNLAGDIKRQTNFAPEYRLRVGSYRVLFEIEDGDRIVIYAVRHRRDSYR